MLAHIVTVREINPFVKDGKGEERDDDLIVCVCVYYRMQSVAYLVPFILIYFRCDEN